MELSFTVDIPTWLSNIPLKFDSTEKAILFQLLKIENTCWHFYNKKLKTTLAIVLHQPDSLIYV